MARFEDNFWGDKHNGYDVLYQNMKYGEQASKDWMDFLRQYAACEEQYCKSLQRLAKSAGAYVVVGSFASVWPVVKASFDKLAQAHQDMSKQWQEMGKEILKYTDGQVKKHKAVKDSQTSTVEVVQTMQHITVTLQKTKEAYQAKFAEYCKARKEHASVKKADKMDADFKKAAEEYRAAVGKYNAAREEFQSKMTDSCKAFQEQEEAHLTQMLTFLKTFAGAHEQKHVEIGEMYYEFHSNVEQLSVAKLLTELVDAKRTGADRPPAAEFEEVDMSLLPKLAAPPEDADGGKKDDSAGQGGGGSAASATMHIIIPGILKKRRGKKQKQQQQGGGGAASQRGSANGESKDGDSLDTQSKSSLPEVDDDGYTIRKDETPKEEDSWDSDTDSGSDGERSRTKIKVEIKPIDRGSNSAGGSEYRLPPRLSSTQLASATAVGGGGVSLSHDRSSSRSKLGDGGGSGFAGGGGGGGGSSLGTGSESSSSASAWDLLGLDLQVGGLSGASMPATPDSERLSAASLSGSAGGGGGTAAATVTVTAATAPGSADSSSTEDREVERLWQSPLERRPAAAVMAAAHEQAAAASAAAAIIQGLPRPPSRRDITGTLSSRQAAAPGRSSPLLLQQRGGGGGAADLLGGNVTAPPLQQPPFSSSRGPSPMCATSSEPLPIAVALTEVMDAYVKTATAGSQQRAASTTRTTGDVMISLPAAVVVKLLAEGGSGSSPPPLVFKLVNVGKLEQWQVNERLVAPSALERDDGCATYAFSMAALVDYLRAKLAENRAAPYFNVDVAKYALKPADADALPLRARAFWRRDATRINFALDYAYNPAGLAKPLPLGNVSFLVPVDGDVTGMQAMPEAQWSPEHRKALWKLDELQQSGASSSGTVRARFELAGGSGAPPATAEVAAAAAPVAVQFACDGTTVSGVDFELVGSGYRLSFAKRRMCTGKYLVDGDIRLASAEVRYV